MILGSILLFIGALISNYAGMRFIECTERAKSMKYTDFAMLLYGPVAAKIVGWCIVLCLLGFCISYIVFLKILIPQILILIFWGSNDWDYDPLPKMIGKGVFSGQIFWATIFCAFVFLPFALPKKFSELFWSSLIGFLLTIYLVVVIVVLFFASRTVVPSMSTQWENSKFFIFSFEGYIRTFPFILYSYMY